MIKQTDLVARIAKFKRFVAMASKKRHGVRYHRMRTIIESYIAQTELEERGYDVSTELFIFGRMTGIAVGCGLISEGQCMMIDQTYANKANPAGP